MLLSWKDGVTTLLAALVVVLYLSSIGYIPLPFSIGTRIAVLIVALVGIGMCAIGSTGTMDKNDPWIAVISLLAIAALLLIIIGLILGNKTVYMLLVGATVLMWFLSTTRHLLHK